MTSVSVNSRISQTVLAYVGEDPNIHTDDLQNAITTSFDDHIVDREQREAAEYAFRRTNLFAWQVAGRPGALQDFNFQQYVSSLSSEQATSFLKAVDMRKGALSTVSVFRKYLCSQVETTAPIKTVTKYESLLEKPFGAEARIFLSQIAYLAHGGKIKGEKGNADWNDLTTTVVPEDSAYTKLLNRVLLNQGCIFSCDKKGDKARKTLAAFVEYLEETAPEGSRFRSEKLGHQHHQLYNVSYTVASAVNDIIENCLGDDASNKISLDDYIHFVKLIHQFENLGNAIFKPELEAIYSPGKNEFRIMVAESELEKLRERRQVAEKDRAPIASFVQSCDDAGKGLFGFFEILRAASPLDAAAFASRVGEKYKDIGVSLTFLLEEVTNTETFNGILECAREILLEKDKALNETLANLAVAEEELRNLAGHPCTSDRGDCKSNGQ